MSVRATTTSLLSLRVRRPVALIIDRDAQDRARMADVLWDEGFDVIPLADEVRARGLIDMGVQPSLVLLDVAVHEVGAAPVGWWRGYRASRATVRVLYLSGEPDCGEGHLQKPVDARLLAAVAAEMVPSVPRTIRSRRATPLDERG